MTRRVMIQLWFFWFALVSPDGTALFFEYRSLDACHIIATRYESITPRHYIVTSCLWAERKTPWPVPDAMG